MNIKYLIQTDACPLKYFSSLGVEECYPSITINFQISIADVKVFEIESIYEYDYKEGSFEFDSVKDVNTFLSNNIFYKELCDYVYYDLHNKTIINTLKSQIATTICSKTDIFELVIDDVLEQVASFLDKEDFQYLYNKYNCNF